MNRGEIWLINLNPTVGAEIQKTRPAIIVNDDELGILPLCVIVPLTNWKDHFESRASENRSRYFKQTNQNIFSGLFSGSFGCK